MMVDEFNLPMANLTRITKAALPSSTKLSKEARQGLLRTASIFVLYLTDTANELAQENGRKTIKSSDVMKALENMEFAKFIPEIQTKLRPKDQNKSADTTQNPASLTE